MPRLIDADLLTIYKYEYDIFEEVSPQTAYKEGWNNAIDAIIENAPTVDAVEVVRCKDCQHYWKNKPSEDVPVCLASPKDDAFCSEGGKGRR